MSNNPEAMGRFLHSAYQRKAGLLRLALDDCGKLVSALRQGQDTSEHLRQLLTLFQEITTLDGKLANARPDGSQVDGPADDELRQLREHLAGLTEQLHRLVQQAEQEAAARRDRIAPELDQILRVRRMQRAYHGRP